MSRTTPDTGFLDDKEKVFLQMLLGRAPEVREEVDAILPEFGRDRREGGADKLWHHLTHRHIVDPDTADDILDHIKYQDLMEGLKKSGVDVKMSFGREDHLFARTALARGALTTDSLTEAMETQRSLEALDVKRPLGSLVFDLELMTREAVQGVLFHMEKTISLRGRYVFPGARISDEEDTRLGSVLRSTGEVPEEEIDSALVHQEKLIKVGIWKPIGEILLERGLLTEPQLCMALGRQAVARVSRAPRRKRTRRARSPQALYAGIGAGVVAALVLAVVVLGGGDDERRPGPKRSRDSGHRDESPPPFFDTPAPSPKPVETEPEPPPKGDGLVDFEGRRITPSELQRIVLTRFASAVRDASADGFNKTPGGGLDFK